MKVIVFDYLIFLYSIFFFCVDDLVTNENNTDTSTTTHIKPAGSGRKRKLRQVRTIISSSIEGLTIDKEPSPKKTSTNVPVDKRPFPFGHW